jgi:hypothetical protein
MYLKTMNGNVWTETKEGVYITLQKPVFFPPRLYCGPVK